MTRLKKPLKEHIENHLFKIWVNFDWTYNTAHDFNVAQVYQLQSVKTQLTTPHTIFVEHQETCESGFNTTFL